MVKDKSSRSNGVAKMFDTKRGRKNTEAKTLILKKSIDINPAVRVLKDNDVDNNHTESTIMSDV